jgi:methylated-DNA-[protein]-cysteine S-methyltransferase
MNQQTRQRTTVDSPIGTITLIAEDDALVEVYLPNGSPPVDAGDGASSAEDDSVLGRASTQLREYFAGERVEFDVPQAWLLDHERAVRQRTA